MKIFSFSVDSQRHYRKRSLLYWPFVAILLSATCMIQSTSASSSYSISTIVLADSQEKYACLNELNDLRLHCGLSPLTLDTPLSEAASNHSQYMANTESLSGEERPGTPFFTGLYPYHRAKYCFYSSVQVVELVLKGRSYELSLAQLLADPAARVTLLSPHYQHLGIGAQENYYSFLLGGDHSSSFPSLYHFPYTDMMDVQNTFLPQLSALPDAIPEQMTMATPISLTYYDMNGEVSFKNVSATLKNLTKDEELRIEIALPGEQGGIDDSIILYPHYLFNSNTQYQVHLSYDLFLDDTFHESCAREWSFSTAAGFS